MHLATNLNAVTYINIYTAKPDKYLTRPSGTS